MRYIVCRNQSEAANDRAVREATVAALDAQLKRGDWRVRYADVELGYIQGLSGISCAAGG